MRLLALVVLCAAAVPAAGQPPAAPPPHPGVTAEPPQPAPPGEKEQPRLVVQTGHSGTVQAAAFSPDSRLLVTAGLDRTAILWDVATGSKLNQFQGHPGNVTAVAVAPDGSRIATIADDSKVRLWDSATGKLLHTVAHKPAPRAITFAPDGAKAYLLGDQVVEWSVATGKTGAAFDIKPGLNVPRAVSPGVGWYTGAGGKPTITGWNLTTGKLGFGLPAQADWINSVSASNDGSRLLVLYGLIPDPSNKAKLLSVPDGKELHTFDGDGATVQSVALSADGKRAALGVRLKGAIVYDAETGKKVCTYKPPGSNCWGVAFAPDGKSVVAWTENAVRLFDAETGQFKTAFEGRAVPVTAIHSPHNADRIVARYGTTERIVWDLTGGRPERAPTRVGSENVVAYDPASNRVLVEGAKHDSYTLFDVSPRKRVAELGPSLDIVSGAAFAGRDRIITVDERIVRVWDASGKYVAGIRHGLPANPKALFPEPKLRGATDGSRFVLELKDAVAVWNTNPLKEVCRLEGFKGYLYEAAFAGDELATVALGGGDDDFRKVRFWDAKTGKHLRDVPVTKDMVSGLAISPNGKQMATGDQAGAVALWETATGKRLWTGSGHWGSVGALAFSPDGTRLYSAGDDGTLRLWDMRSGEWRLGAAYFAGGSWAVFDREGRFDASDLDAVRGLHWVVPDEPFRALSPEIFMRDYYEPKLLARILAGEKFKPIRSLAELNRVQPVVKVAKVEPQPGRADEVRVTVEVAGQARTSARGAGPVLVESGAFDLHLFRDGQLVGLRNGALALDPKTGRAAVAFERVKLPAAGKKQVEFSAYAFNADRVKSETARLAHALPAGLAVRKGTAYVVCVGVNAFDEKGWDLRFAAPDAKLMAATLGDALKKTGQYQKVVAVSLLSEPRTDKDGKRVGIDSTATRENLRGVLLALAGQKPDERLLKAVPAACDLAEARPEDAVILTFSTHGYNGGDGRFYLLPSDIGTGHGGRVTDALLKRCVSSDDLSEWLRGVDAGEMVMVADACQSAGSVEQEGFKPGPMGSRGLGQLAYDKRMRVLAASQADDVALEDARVGHGLLTYALCKDGLGGGKADFEPADGRVTLGEWLRYGVRRVPALAEEIAAGKLAATRSTDRALRKVGKQTVAQLPALFDFTKGANDPILVPLQKK